MFQDIGNNPDHMQVLFYQSSLLYKRFYWVSKIRYIFILALLFDLFLKFYHIQL